MTFNPILRDLHADRAHVTVHLRQVDIRIHYADMLRHSDDEEIAKLASDQDDLIELLRGYLEADPTLVDQSLETQCWEALDIDLIDDLSKSLGIEPDSIEPVELARLWLAEADKSDIFRVQEDRLVHRLGSRLGVIRRDFEMDTSPAMLTAAFMELMTIPGAYGALSSALNQVGPANPAGVLRLAGDLARKAP